MKTVPAQLPLIAYHMGGPTIRFDDRAEEAAKRAILRDIAKSRARQAACDAAFPGGGREKMVRLCALFPGLRNAPGTRPWDVEELVLWIISRGHSTSVLHSARFVLDVWNSHSDWPTLLREEAALESPRGETRKSNFLWEGLQRLRSQVRDDLIDEERGRAKDYGTTFQAPTADQVRDALHACFDVLTRFVVTDAFSCWDETHRKAFLTWAQHPFFP